ncbi:MAG: hypothetical protein ACTSWF_07310, partial [Candidatus Freyarchaeota archaeon]
IPSENVMSPRAREVLRSDLGHRYTSPDRFYAGTKYIDQILERGEKLAREVFGCKFADLRPLSGHVADLSLLMAFRGKSIACISESDGGGTWASLRTTLREVWESGFTTCRTFRRKPTSILKRASS